MAGTQDIEVALPLRQLERLARLEAEGAHRDEVIAKALDLYLEQLEAEKPGVEKKA